MKDSPKPLAAPTAAPPPKPSLDDLAKQINRRHRLCVTTARAGLAHALRAGRLLQQAKALCGGHGKWLPWLAEHFPGSPRVARTYMQLARRWSELQGKRRRAAVLSLRAALAALPKKRTPKPTQPKAPEDQADDLGNGTFAEAYRAFRREVARTKTDGFERVSRKAVQRHLRLLAMMVGGRIETATHERTENWRLAELVERLVTLADVPPSELALGDLRQTAKDIGEIVLGPEGDGRVELTTECAA